MIERTRIYQDIFDYFYLSAYAFYLVDDERYRLIAASLTSMLSFLFAQKQLSVQSSLVGNSEGSEKAS